MEKLLELTAYHHWLLSQTDDVEVLAQLIYDNIFQDQNPQAFELLNKTGDKEYTIDTFYKAAKLLLNSKETC